MKFRDDGEENIDSQKLINFHKNQTRIFPIFLVQQVQDVLIEKLQEKKEKII